MLILNILDKNYYKVINSFIEKNFQNKEVEIFFNLENKYLKNFYKNSSFYVFTSYSEVFGFTTLEALSFNVPILVSNTSSLKEINENVAEYFDPDDINEIKEKLKKLNSIPKLNEKKIYEYNEHLKKYLWQENLQKTFDIIKENENM